MVGINTYAINIDTKLINKVKNKYLKTLKKLNIKIQKEEINIELLINYLNQLYFINQNLQKLNTDIFNLNTCINNNKIIPQKKKIKNDNLELQMENSINVFKPYIIAHYLNSLAS